MGSRKPYLGSVDHRALDIVLAVCGLSQVEIADRLGARHADVRGMVAGFKRPTVEFQQTVLYAVQARLFKSPQLCDGCDKVRPIVAAPWGRSLLCKDCAEGEIEASRAEVDRLQAEVKRLSPINEGSGTHV